MDSEIEVYFTCPYCWQKISMMLETGYGSQKYIEDCEVCCKPIELEYVLEGGKVVVIEAREAE